MARSASVGQRPDPAATKPAQQIQQIQQIQQEQQKQQKQQIQQDRRHRITLITGDRVLVDAKGRITGFERPEDRRRIPIRTHTQQGRTYAIPLDAQRLISSGRLDRQLFDITELSSPAARSAYAKGLRTIVGYRGDAAKTARAQARSAADSEGRRGLSTLGADALTAPPDGGSALWRALTRPGRGGMATTEPGVDRIWLDAVVRATLDTSAGRIGTPAAWQAGHDGTGVTLAVLDSGIDTTHPDLVGKVSAERNFSDAPDARDRNGHGTHVASTAAGTGAGSGGKFKGVAPGAKLLNGKVLNDSGEGTFTGIIEGIDWAVAQGADIVNLSLGGTDHPGIDPLEAHVNKVSAEKGVLFAVAAGNEGRRGAGTIGSPGSADAALTVGAVDDQDRIADFSSRGPRVGDGGLKPDVTAPGVDITAAAASGVPGQNPAGYTSLSGTSMAAPHVAGAAALLKQKHPTWTPARLKAALTGSAEPGNHTAYQQGSGRIAVDRAIGQTVLAEPVSFDFGLQRWPHHDDTPVTKRVTYRNTGTEPVTLDLTVETTGPGGSPAPAGFFALDTPRVTVPAGGTAAVGLTADTRLGGTADGHYSAAVTATGGGRTIRTAAAVDREVESYDLTLHHVKRPGMANWGTDVVGYAGLAKGRRVEPDMSTGTVTLRLPKGDYALEAIDVSDPTAPTSATDRVVQPKLSLTGDTTVALDARTTRPVSITVPDAQANREYLEAEYVVGRGGDQHGSALQTGSDLLRTAHVGPDVTDGSLRQIWSGQWNRGTTDYGVTTGGPARRLATGFTQQYTVGDMAKVEVGLGASAPGKESHLSVRGHVPGKGGWSWYPVPQPAPGVRTVWLSTGDQVTWDMESYIYGRDAQGQEVHEGSHYFPAPKTYRPGKTYRENFHTGVHGPLLTGDFGVFRDGDTIRAALPVFADGQGNPGSSVYSSVDTVLRRDDTELIRNQDPLDGSGTFTVPAGPGAYSLETSIRRDPSVARTADRIDAHWHFHSATTASRTRLPLSTVRFGAAVDTDGTVPAGVTQLVPLRLQGPAAAGNVTWSQVRASYDGGTTWQELPVRNGRVGVRNPDKGASVSLQATFTYPQGKASVTVHNAYYGR
ncbi:S8 family peptidase [Streptomyces yaizuensis]